MAFDGVLQRDPTPVVARIARGDPNERVMRIALLMLPMWGLDRFDELCEFVKMDLDEKVILGFNPVILINLISF